MKINLCSFCMLALYVTLASSCVSTAAALEAASVAKDATAVLSIDKINTVSFERNESDPTKYDVLIAVDIKVYHAFQWSFLKDSEHTRLNILSGSTSIPSESVRFFVASKPLSDNLSSAFVSGAEPPLKKSRSQTKDISNAEKMLAFYNTYGRFKTVPSGPSYLYIELSGVEVVPAQKITVKGSLAAKYSMYKRSFLDVDLNDQSKNDDIEIEGRRWRFMEIKAKEFRLAGPVLLKKKMGLFFLDVNGKDIADGVITRAPKLPTTGGLNPFSVELHQTLAKNVSEVERWGIVNRGVREVKERVLTLDLALNGAF